MNTKKIFVTIKVMLVTLLFSCNTVVDSPNLVLIFIDGPRISETWNSTENNIEFQKNVLAKEGVFFSNFYNNGITATTPGHTAVLTGLYENINNSGKQIPKNKSFIQKWLKETNQKQEKAWIITSKDKLEVLSNCKDKKWKDKYNPKTNCGVNGLSTGYRHDSITLLKSLEVLKKEKPNILVINFREPDYSGHDNNWNNYIKGIKDTDNYIKTIWSHLQKSEYYRKNTVLIITNDHGRHLDNNKDGFVSHGDDCKGCRHISLLIAGKGIKKTQRVNNNYELIDLYPAILKILNLEQEKTLGKVINEIFE